MATNAEIGRAAFFRGTMANFRNVWEIGPEFIIFFNGFNFLAPHKNFRDL